MRPGAGSADELGETMAGSKPPTRAPRKSATSARPSLVFVAVGVVATGLYFLLPAAVQDFAYDVFGLACVIAIAVGVRRNRP